MKENELYTAIVQGALRYGMLLTKIVDGSLGKKPFDIFGCTIQGFAVAIEVKVWRKSYHPSKLPEDQFESQQLTFLREYATREHAISIALIYLSQLDKIMVYDFKSESYIGFLRKSEDKLWLGWSDLEDLGFGPVASRA